jgi:hypothetical protein
MADDDWLAAWRKKLAGCNEFWAKSCKGIRNYFFSKYLATEWMDTNEFE